MNSTTSALISKTSGSMRRTVILTTPTFPCCLFRGRSNCCDLDLPIFPPYFQQEALTCFTLMMASFVLESLQASWKGSPPWVSILRVDSRTTVSKPWDCSETFVTSWLFGLDWSLMRDIWLYPYHSVPLALTHGKYQLSWIKLRYLLSFKSSSPVFELWLEQGCVDVEKYLTIWSEDSKLNQLWMSKRDLVFDSFDRGLPWRSRSCPAKFINTMLW